MKININDLDSDIKKMYFSIKAKQWELDTDDIKFLDDIEIEAGLRRFNSEVLVEAMIKCRKSIRCARCLDEKEVADEYEFCQSYNVHEIDEDLDLENDIREEILLNWPLSVFCQEDCKGMDINTGEKIN